MPLPRPTASVEPLRWNERSGQIEMIDQRVLPARFDLLGYDSAAGVAAGHPQHGRARRARHRLRRGLWRGARGAAPAAPRAPAFAAGMSAAFEAAGAKPAYRGQSVLGAAAHAGCAGAQAQAQLQSRTGTQHRARALLREAHAILAEDVRANRAMGAHGAALLPATARVLTHCNAGALATAGHGTALGVIRSAVEAGKRISVIVDETRPFLQGARLTVWELQQDNIPVTLITDNMAGHMMQQGAVDAVIVGADRIAANGDFANKIGTYMVAVLAHRHAIPFYVAAPLSTIDRALASGEQIPIEERGADEVRGFARSALGAGRCRGTQPGVRCDAGRAGHRADHRKGRGRGHRLRRHCGAVRLAWRMPVKIAIRSHWSRAWFSRRQRRYISHADCAAIIRRPPQDYTVAQDWERYTRDEHAIWATLYQRQIDLIERYAAPEFLAGVRALGASASGIPRFEDANRVLQAATGWRIVAVPGLIPEETFFDHLAHLRFPVTVWIRRREELDYLVEPDVFHDFFGHVPLLTNPVFARFMQAYGQAGPKALATPGGLRMLARLYWYMVEFGLIRTASGLRVYGAGILSSKGETVYSIESPEPQRAGLRSGARDAHRLPDR